MPKQNRNTWIVLQMKDGKPTGVMYDPKVWESESSYIGNAIFQGVRVESENDLVERTGYYMMPKQTADHWAKALNVINKAESTLKRDKNLARVTFKALKMTVKP